MNDVRFRGRPRHARVRDDFRPKKPDPPATGRCPTCHRALPLSRLQDPDFTECVCCKLDRIEAKHRDEEVSHQEEEPARKPGRERPGTVLDLKHCIDVLGWKPKAKVRASIGKVDTTHRVFQCGGEMENFYYRKERLLSFPGDVWRQLTPGPLGRLIDTVELIDNTHDKVYRVSFQTACSEGSWYDRGIGIRWGVPIDLWVQSDE